MKWTMERHPLDSMEWQWFSIVYTTIGKTIFWYRTGSPPNHCSGLLDNVQLAYDEQHVQLKKPDQATMSDQHEKLDTL